MSDDFKLNTKGLDKFIETFTGPMPYVAVGVLGTKMARNVSDVTAGPELKTNAQVGAAHEFGTSILPRRSFLRFPLNMYLAKRAASSGATSATEMNAIIRTGDLESWLKKMGILAEGIIQEAFASGGFGAWQRSNMKDKKVKQTLIETQQLRNSITSEVRA